MIKLKDIKAGWIIHTFALLHAVVTLACRYAGFNDELLLTVLTMTMVLLICMKKWISIEFAAACVIVANVFGYMMGHFGAELLQPLIGTNPAANAVATVLTTEFLGWTIVGITRLFRHREKEDTEISLLSPQMQWMLAAVGIIVYGQSYGFMQLYQAPRQMGFLAASAILLGGASTSRAKISNVIIGTFLFQGVLTLGMPVANALIPGSTISETLRILISNGIILYALTKSGGASRG